MDAIMQYENMFRNKCVRMKLLSKRRPARQAARNHKKATKSRKVFFVADL